MEGIMGRERPIVFDGDSVQAILEGRKTETRRGVKQQTEHGGRSDLIDTKCPYGVAGDQLWVRETWRIDGWDSVGGLWIEYRTTPGHSVFVCDGTDDEGGYYNDLMEQCTQDCEKAGLKPNYDDDEYTWEPGHSPCRWRSPIFLPRWASRIELNVADSFPQRIQEITYEQVLAEGCPAELHGDTVAAREWFRARWDHLNAKRGYPWANNPWVWVVRFEVGSCKTD